MAGKKAKRFEVWGQVNSGDWDKAGDFDDLAGADAYCRANQAIKGVKAFRIVDVDGEITAREYKCKAPAKAA